MPRTKPSLTILVNLFLMFLSNEARAGLSMLTRTGRSILAAASCFSLVGCAGYVDKFSSRIDNGDDAYNQSIASDVLKNVIRAGYNEPTSFVGLGKYTGTNNTTLNGAIPGFTLSKDPLQIAVTGFSGKEDTNAQIEATVLNTRNFVGGMLTPIDLTTFKSFIDQGYPRELLLYLFIDQFRITDTATGRVTVLRNDPSLDEGQACNRHDYTDYANRQAVNRNQPAEYGPILGRTDCEYHRFQYWVEEAMRYGFNIDFPVVQAAPASGGTKAAASTTDGAAKAPASATSSAGSNDKKKDQPPIPTGRICYDLGLMSTDTESHLLADSGNSQFGSSGKADSPICRSQPKNPPKKGLTLAEALPFVEGNRRINVRVSADTRSPAAMFRYIGRLTTRLSFNATELFETTAVTTRDHRLFAIYQNRTKYCYAVSVHYGVPFCVPQESPNAKAVISILASLVQLNTGREDVPTNTTSINISP